MMEGIAPESLAGIQYLGLSGDPKSCKNSISRLIQFGDEIHKAKLLTCPRTHSSTHCFLLDVNYDELIAIKSGFSSGYHGGGPAALSVALQLLNRHGAKIEEYEVSAEVIGRLKQSCLTAGDIQTIEALHPIRPSQWRDYIYDLETTLKYNEKFNNEKLRCEFPEVVPFGIVDTRIIDLALCFEEQPDSSIMSGYRRLEDLVRKRTGLAESSSKLFSKAFQGDESVLYWQDIDSGEQTGRASLFTGTYLAFRNRRAHREPDPYAGGTLQEFLLLNQLYLLEKESIERVVGKPK